MVQRNGHWTEISLEVVPLPTSFGQHYLIAFDEQEPRRRKGQKVAKRRPMAAKADHEIFGKGKFELRDKLDQVGATIVAAAANGRSKKGVPRRTPVKN